MALTMKYCSANRITSASICPNTSRRIGRQKSSAAAITDTVLTASTVYSWAALLRAFSPSCRPRYWLPITAPPVASAARTWMISTLMLSTRLTLETAASPTPETIRVSAIPIVTLRICSSSIGRIRAVSAWRLNSGRLCEVCVAMSIFSSRPIPESRPGHGGRACLCVL